MTITQEDLEYLRTVFVSRDSCDAKNDQMQKDITEIKITQTSIQTKQNMTLGILAAIGAAVLSIAIKLLFGG